MRSRAATEPRPVSLTVNRAPGSADLTNSTVPSVHPSAVMRISSGAGARRRSTSQVRRRSATRFLVVIMMDVVKDKPTRLPRISRMARMGRDCYGLKAES